MPSQQTVQTTFLGGWDLSISVALFLQGVLCGQFAYYTNVNKRDSGRLKLFVTGLALLTTLKTIQVLTVMWIQNVTLFHNVQAASSLVSFVAVSGQKISHNAYIIVVCMTSFTFALVSGGVGVWFIYFFAKDKRLGVPPSGGRVVWRPSFDREYRVLLASADIPKPSSPAGPLHPSSALSVEWQYKQSAAPPALCALINFVFALLVHAQSANTPVSSMISSGSNTVLPQLYVWAAMWTLNSREDIYLADNNQCTLHPELRGTSDSETAGHPIVHADGGNKRIDHQRGGVKIN
ncbi:hypothetical protein B0H19DRAFT_1268486 [Mycena capillaripes]|nr:hypothetical protein B0H19DRAFT_1268486 [Mycena capillaripes]